MILSRLHLINFRQYERAELSFKNGITGIVGRNGAGKSTILEAILWCLFGSRAARTGKEGIKRQTASATEDCSVELEFRLGNNTYCLTRSLIGKNSRSEAQLSQKGKLDAVTTREVDDYVVRLIGLNLKGFLSSFFARQKELNALSEARPADRKDHLARMLGVGRLDNAIQLLKEDIKTTRQKIDILGSLQVDPELVSRELALYNDEKADLERSRASRFKDLGDFEAGILKQAGEVEAMRVRERQNSRLENEQATLSARLETTEQEIKRLTSEMAELEGLSEKLASIQKEAEGIDVLEKAVVDLKQAKVQQEEFRRLTGEAENLKRAEKDHQRREADIAEAITRSEKALEEKEQVVARIAEAEVRLESLLQEHRELGGEIRVVEDKLATMEKQKAEINELGPEASCQMCLRPFAGELDEIERHFDQEILSLRQQLTPMKRRLDEITEQGKTLRRDLKLDKERLDQFNRQERELATARADLKGIITAEQELKKRMIPIAKRLEEIGEIVFDPAVLTQKETALKQKQAKRDKYIRLAERAARKPVVEKRLLEAGQNLATVKTGLDQNAAQKKELNFDREVFGKAVADLEKNREEAAGVRLEIERTDGRIRLLTSEIEAREKKLAEFEKSKREIKVLRESLTYLEKLSLLFTEFRIYLIGRIRPSLSRRTSQLFHEMTGGRYQEIELDEDYSLRVFDRGEPFTIERFSGGEVDLANLCFRLAISVEMAASAGIDQSFIILDEIFGSQDTERQRMIFEGLGRLKNRFRQIIIISHIDDVKEMAENIINVEIDSSGFSRAIPVEN